MIKNDYQFKICFYSYIMNINFESDDELINSLEKCLKDYLMYHGFKSFIRDNDEVLKCYIYHDLDDLMYFYKKYGEI